MEFCISTKRERRKRQAKAAEKANTNNYCHKKKVTTNLWQQSDKVIANLLPKCYEPSEPSSYLLSNFHTKKSGQKKTNEKKTNLLLLRLDKAVCCFLSFSAFFLSGDMCAGIKY